MISAHAKPLWPIASFNDVGSVTMAKSARQSRTSLGAETQMFLIGDASDDQPARASSWPPGPRPPRSSPRRRLHVFRSATVQPSVRHRGVNGSTMPSTPTVSGATRTSPTAPARDPRARQPRWGDRRDIRDDVQSALSAHAPRSAASRSPGAPGTSDGLIELAATRSDSSAYIHDRDQTC